MGLLLPTLLKASEDKLLLDSALEKKPPESRVQGARGSSPEQLQPTQALVLLAAVPKRTRLGKGALNIRYSSFSEQGCVLGRCSGTSCLGRKGNVQNP